MKTKKVCSKDVGRFVRVIFSDVGAVDGIITAVNGPNDFHFIELSHLRNGPVSNNGAPAVRLGADITGENSGLDK